VSGTSLQNQPYCSNARYVVYRLYFLWAGIFLGKEGAIILTIAFLLMVPVTWLLALGTYTGKTTYGKVAGFLSAIDGVLFFIIAFSGAVGHHLP
jgi:hypothetical protein